MFQEAGTIAGRILDQAPQPAHPGVAALVVPAPSPRCCRRCLTGSRFGLLVIVEVKLDLAQEAPCLLLGKDEDARDHGAGAGSK